MSNVCHTAFIPDLSKDPKVEIVSETTETIIPTMKKGKKGKKVVSQS